ncbi:MAG: cation:proton antiporter [Methylovulum sp.]|uniref:cation:proton antiporter family protein n=1 Tax=Methylovulum sp. TaxID=1916980 RepID=UPI00261586DF|nr:cation:proton antiporter family protein [Methylovulum sp.]MDD2724296.1 cation:proton antiporter [Methylovulum sp.]MDD5122971.1 cation:proton antiporter [Methylovulum sp.]
MELVLVGTAYMAGLITSSLYFPPLVGYLIAGYILHALGVHPDNTLAHLADIGIQLLLFTVGLKLKLRSLLRREVLSVGGMHLLIVTGISVAIFFALGGYISGGLVLGISLAFSSTVLAIKVLEDNGELSTMHGRDVLSILILQDIVAIGLLAFTSGKQPTLWALGLLLLPLLRPLAYRLLNASHADELKLLLGVSLALAGGMLAEEVGISNEIGALLMGVTLAGHAKIDELADKLWGLKETFLVAFFLQIGLTDLPGYDELLQALLLLAILPLQGWLFFSLFLVVGLRARNAFISSLALMTYSEFALITSNAVIDAHLLPPVWEAIIGLAVAMSLAVAAPLNRFSHRLFSLLEPFLIRFERQVNHPDRLPNSIGIAEWLVIGMGRTGMSAYQAFCEQDKRVLGLDADPTVLEALLADGRRVVYGDAEDKALWEKLPLAKIKGIVLAMPEFEVRASSIMQLKTRQFQGHVGTVCFHDDEEPKLYGLGASFVIHPLTEAGRQLAEQMLNFNQQSNLVPLPEQDVGAIN